LSNRLRQNYDSMKLPKPRKRGDSWLIEFMLNGHRYSATRDTQLEAKDWAMREIVRLKDDAKRTGAGELPSHTLKELCSIYLLKVTKHKKGRDSESKRINALLTNYPKLANKTLETIAPKDIILWKNDRLKLVADSTVKRELNLLSSIFSYGIKEMLWLHDNPVSKVTKPSEAKPRCRRISQDEIAVILNACGYIKGEIPTTQRHYVAWCFLFAIETAMRTGEILSLKWVNVYDDFVVLPDTKNGSRREVPLLPSAIELIGLVKGIDKAQVMPLSSDSLKKIFARIVSSVGIENLTFHDTRHEATTRLAQLLDVKDLSKVTGHKDINVLVNTYYNPTASELAAKMRSKAG
jgi:integrase